MPIRLSISAGNPGRRIWPVDAARSGYDAPPGHHPIVCYLRPYVCAVAPWSNEAAYMVNYTSVVSLIAVADLFGEARRIMSRHYNQMLMLPLVGLVYLAIVLLIAYAARRETCCNRESGGSSTHVMVPRSLSSNLNVARERHVATGAFQLGSRPLRSPTAPPNPTCRSLVPAGGLASSSLQAGPR